MSTTLPLFQGQKVWEYKSAQDIQRIMYLVFLLGPILGMSCDFHDESLAVVLVILFTEVLTSIMLVLKVKQKQRHF